MRAGYTRDTMEVDSIFDGLQYEYTFLPMRASFAKRKDLIDLANVLVSSEKDVTLL